MHEDPPTTVHPFRPTLVEAVSARIRRLNCSLRTEKAYVHWTRHFVRFCDNRHRRELGPGTSSGS